MRSGFLITEKGSTTLGLFETEPSIRYAAEFDDGRGFAAYDVETFADVLELSTHGYVLVEVPGEQQEDADEFLKRLSRGPKRQSAVGDERFVLYAAASFEIPARLALAELAKFEPRAACVVAADPESLYILVETGPEWDCPIPAIWDRSVVAYRDVRLEASV